MTLRWWGHALFAAGYVALAAVTMVLLPLLRPQIDAVTIVLAGAVVALAGGLIHEVVARREQQARQAEQWLRLQRSYEEGTDRPLRQSRDTVPDPDPGPAAEPAGPVPPGRRPAIRPLRVPPPSEPRALPDPTAGAGAGAGLGLGSGVVPAVTAATGIDLGSDDTMAAAIREALADQRVEFHLQPVVSLPQRRHRFYEVLPRLRLPGGEVIGPERYFQAAQREHLLPTIDLLLLIRTAQLIRETDRRQHAIGFFCNISPVTLLDAGFQAQFVRGADHPGLRAKLMFEVSQRDLLAEVPAVMTALADLRRLGYRFCLGRIERPGVDPDWAAAQEIRYLKIQAAVLASPDWRAAVTDLRGRLAGRTMALIAERVETERQLADALDLGFGFGQGPLLGAPRPSRRPVPA